MRRDREAARRYSRALFDLCLAGSDTELAAPEEVLAELQAFHEALTKNEDLQKLFYSPVVSKAEKLELLSELESKLRRVYRFLSLLVEADRMASLGDIIEFFKASLEEHRGELSVQLKVARPLSGDLETRIRSFLEMEWKRKIKLSVKEDQDLIGGFVAKAPGRTLDGSVRTQLERLKQRVAS